MERFCYVYCLYDKTECKVRYIGVTLNLSKRFWKHKNCNREERLKRHHKSRWVAKCKDLGMKVLFVGPEKDCYKLEVELIAKYKSKHRLTNMSSGGDKPNPTYLYGGMNGRAVAVLQYDLKGNYIQEFSSCIEAGKHVGVHRTSISDCINGRSKKSGGYVWRKK